MAGIITACRIALYGPGKANDRGKHACPFIVGLIGAKKTAWRAEI